MSIVNNVKIELCRIYIKNNIKELVWKVTATQTATINGTSFLFRVNSYAIKPIPTANICLIPENIIENVDIVQNNTIIRDGSKHNLLYVGYIKQLVTIAVVAKKNWGSFDNIDIISIYKEKHYLKVMKGFDKIFQTNSKR